MRKIAWSFAFFVLLALVAPSASADIVRHCNGEILALPGSFVDENGDRHQPMHQNPWTGSKTVIKLKGRGKCKNRFQKNTCRRNARDAILSCGRAIWNERWSRIVPLEQCETADNGRPPHAGVTWWNTRIHRGDIKSSIEFEACCKMKPKAQSFNVSVFLRSSGDAGCEHGSTLVSTYENNCTRLRAQGLCERPVSEWGARRK